MNNQKFIRIKKCICTLKVCVCGSYPCPLSTHPALPLGAQLWEVQLVEELRVEDLRVEAVRVDALKMDSLLVEPDPHPDQRAVVAAVTWTLHSRFF